MPRVVIELQANTQDAVNKIQQFARAQKDAFDAIKVGNATLADATVKVGKLTESTAGAARGMGALDAAGKNWIQGSLRELTGGIPILDSALTKMIGTLSGFPLVAGGAVAGGVLLIKTLSEISAEASKANAAIETLAKSIEADLQRTMGTIAKLRAEGAGNVGGALAIGAQNQIKALEDARDAAIAAAQKELDKTPDPRGAVIPISLPERMIAEGKFQTARAKAAEEAALKIFEIETKLKNDLNQLETNYDTKLAEHQEKRLESAEQAAETQAKLLETLAAKSLAIFQGLGAGFEKATQALQLAQFVKNSTAAIDTLTQAMAAGLDTTGSFAAGIKALQEKMAEVIQLGYVPTVAAAQQVAAAVRDADAATRQFLATQNALRTAMAGAGSLPGTTAGATPADIALKGAAVYALAPRTGIDVPGQGIYEPVWQPEWAKAPRSAGSPMPSFQAGGLVPGVGPVPILAHGGERIVPAGGDGGRMVRIEPGAIQIAGTIIQQSRDWDVLVESLGQALAARLR